jgi:ABC-type multidrug transport system fused ATPase/permease subunit
MYTRVLFVSLGFVASVGTAIVYFVGGNLVISGTLSIGTLAAFVIYVGQIYNRSRSSRTPGSTSSPRSSRSSGCSR